MLELWEERTFEERLQSSKETKRWTTGENQKENVTCDVLQDDFILYEDNIYEYWVVYSGASFHATPIGDIFKIMFKVILDRFIWVMMNHVKLLEWVRYK